MGDLMYKEKPKEKNIIKKMTHPSLKKNNKLQVSLDKSWSKLSAFWPLENLVASNPLAGLESLDFEQALLEAKTLFQNDHIPNKLGDVNRQSIKWLQAYFDEGQSSFFMPMRHKGFLHSFLQLLPYDDLIINDNRDFLDHLQQPHLYAKSIIQMALDYLDVPNKDHALFLTLMLTSLSGWSCYVQYKAQYKDDAQIKDDFLAFRLILICFLYPKAHRLLAWYQNIKAVANIGTFYTQLEKRESKYRQNILPKLSYLEDNRIENTYNAAFIFCIDVRSEPFRHALEGTGKYATYGFAGFFGAPVHIKNNITKNAHDSCPVLLKPSHIISEDTPNNSKKHQRDYQKYGLFRKLYQSIKYTFATPFALVETIGLGAGFWMFMRSIMPNMAHQLKHKFRKKMFGGYILKPDIKAIPPKDQITYALNILKVMGLTNKLPKIIILCGHGSQTKNNAHATALDCGACGGRKGAPNARIMADILNQEAIKTALKQHNIDADNSFFMAAEHNTTTDAVTLFDHDIDEKMRPDLLQLKEDLHKARHINNLFRLPQLAKDIPAKNAMKKTALRSVDWAQTRPEWGLANNASFIIGPRDISKNNSLDGRSFLHSYDYSQDIDGSSLTAILTAPMVVTQWINAQYFFSAMDNVSFGGGSKVTKNVTGKIGIMQGNASDLMHGLPLQSVRRTDQIPYHEILRLQVITYAPTEYLDKIIPQHDILQKLFKGGWVHLICMDPLKKAHYHLQKDLTWKII